MWLSVLATLACERPEATGTLPKTTPTSTEPTTETTPPPVDTSTIDTSSTGETADTGEGPDCSVLPPVPVSYTTLTEFYTSEDFDIDGDGYLCTIDYARNLACRDLYGNHKVISPNVSPSTAGTRVLATGDWVVADVANGALILIDGQTGGQTVLASNLLYPNGVEVDADNMVYVAENNGGRVRQIDAYTGEQWIVSNNLIQPNGVILSPDGNTLYVGSFGGGIVYAIDRLGPTDWDQARILYDPVGPDGGFDGINVDQCGNVYITEFTTGRVYRITPSGQGDLVVDLQAGWIPNMRWGHDINGWRSDVLYVTSWSSIFALEMQIPGKRHLLAP